MNTDENFEKLSSLFEAKERYPEVGMLKCIELEMLPKLEEKLSKKILDKIEKKINTLSDKMITK